MSIAPGASFLEEPVELDFPYCRHWSWWASTTSIVQAVGRDAVLCVRRA